MYAFICTVKSDLFYVRTQLNMCLICTVQYSTVQYSTVQYSTVQYSAVQYSVLVVYAFMYKLKLDIIQILKTSFLFF